MLVYMESTLLDTFDTWCCTNQFELTLCCNTANRFELKNHMNGVHTPIEFLERFWEIVDISRSHDFCAYQFVKEFNISYNEKKSKSIIS